jgi:homogentisate 1,2-dioxygenase
MHQYSQGKFTTQGHKGIPEGHFEEEQGRKGFFGLVSHLIKPKPSTRWKKIEGPLRPHLFDVVELKKNYGKWQRLLYNSSVVISTCWEKKSENLSAQAFRNADGDTLYFCHQGAGQVMTEYGLLSFKKGSYVSLPKSMTHTFFFTEDTQFLIIESLRTAFAEPDRGMLGKNGFYDLAALGKPDLEQLQAFKKEKSSKVTEVHVKRWNQMTKFSYDEDIYDTVGWKGDLFPFTLHVDDLMPIVSGRVHLPPSVHTTFVAQGFVVCTFLPRRIEEDADALKVPFYHQNMDFDEVLFYHDGNFFSRDNLHAGMMTLHPAGFPHGPHPKAVKNISSKTHTDEYAVMIDTWETLQVDQNLESVEVQDYWQSWMK